MIYLILEGRLGNQLFEYAAALRMRELRGRQEKIVIDDTDVINTNCVDLLQKLNLYNTEFVHDNEYRWRREFKVQRHCVTVYEWFINKRSVMRKFRLEQFFQALFNYYGYVACTTGYIKYHCPSTESVLMSGYFQSRAYFENMDQKLKMLFDFSKMVGEKTCSELQNICEGNSVCVHIRRGDYVNTEFDVCSIDYYNNAVQKMLGEETGLQFYIFSDDIEWAKKNLNQISNMKYIEGEQDYEDFYLMYHCHHFIMSNSSYSWWAQYLSDYTKKKVIAPKKWKNVKIPEGIYQSNWILI